MKSKIAVLSVSNKDRLTWIGQSLAERDYWLVSTGGTAKTLRDAGLTVTDVSEHTGFPEGMDGRLKTLHPRIHGGLLGRPKDVEYMIKHGIHFIDVLVCNLYPFQKTVESGSDYETINNNIDIGGPAMIRAAAKNDARVTVLTHPDQYKQFLIDMDESANGGTTARFRYDMATAAYELTAAYDKSIADFRRIHPIALQHAGSL